MTTVVRPYPGYPTHNHYGHHETTLTPPQLPPSLATLFDLRPITGLPSAEEIKLIHAAIRTLNTLLHTPEFQGSNLPVELSQYLFDVQMVCYHEKHSIGISTNDIAYIPPSLPAHIPVKLDPVIGPPSDDQLQSAQTALRTLDSLANVASLFDTDLSMHLSQHLFDLQMARHFQRSIGGQPRAQPPPPNHSSTGTGTCTNTGTQGSNIIDNSNTSPGGSPSQREPPESGGAERDRTQGVNTDLADKPTAADEERRTTESKESTKALVEIREILKDVIKVLVASQNSLAKGFNSSRRAPGDGYSFGAHSLINSKGETPEMQGLPTTRSCSWYYESTGFVEKLSATLLARYLQFYGIGSEMIEAGIVPSIKPGKEEDAKKLLMKHLYIVAGPGA